MVISERPVFGEGGDTPAGRTPGELDEVGDCVGLAVQPPRPCGVTVTRNCRLPTSTPHSCAPIRSCSSGTAIHQPAQLVVDPRCRRLLRWLHAGSAWARTRRRRGPREVTACRAAHRRAPGPHRPRAVREHRQGLEQSRGADQLRRPRADRALDLGRPCAVGDRTHLGRVRGGGAVDPDGRAFPARWRTAPRARVDRAVARRARAAGSGGRRASAVTCDPQDVTTAL